MRSQLLTLSMAMAVTLPLHAQVEFPARLAGHAESGLFSLDRCSQVSTTESGLSDRLLTPCS